MSSDSAKDWSTLVTIDNRSRLQVTVTESEVLKGEWQTKPQPTVPAHEKAQFHLGAKDNESLGWVRYRIGDSGSFRVNFGHKSGNPDVIANWSEWSVPPELGIFPHAPHVFGRNPADVHFILGPLES